MKASQAENLVRSTIAPLMRATVMAAKVIWKMAYNPVGMVGARVDRELDSTTPAKKGLVSCPIIPQTLLPKARS